MALQKAITNPRTGVSAQYWRVVQINLTPADGVGKILLGGYVSPEIRNGGGIYVDQRDYDLGPAQFAALAASPAVGNTMFDAIGSGAYAYIRNARRLADNYDQQSGTATLAGVEYSGADVVNLGTVEQPVWTVPSEFADAVDV